MKSRTCYRIQAILRSGAAVAVEERHLFACEECRAESRALLALRALPSPLESEAPPPADEAFVARVLQSVRVDRFRRQRGRRRLAAAAAVLLLFTTGLGFVAERVRSAREDATAILVALLATSPWEELEMSDL